MAEATTKPSGKGALQGILTLVVLVLLAGGALLFMFGTVVPPGSMGVRQIMFGPGQGYSEKALEAGYHWTVPFYSTVHVIPRTVQTIEFASGGETDGNQETVPALEVQSAERAAVDIDLTVLYRFFTSAKEGANGGPRDLFRIGANLERWKTAVQLTVQAQLLEGLRELRTAEFYQYEKREPLIEKAKDDMNRELEKQGIHIEFVLLRRFSYREPQIDNAIFQKNLQEQEKARNVAQQAFVTAQGDAKKKEAEMKAEIDSLRVKAESVARVIRSEGDLYEAQRVAEGDLLVARATAEVDRLRANALAQSTGAPIYVGREIAPLLSSLKGGVVSGIDPYDLGAWSKRLGAEGGK